jgi:HK97 gp10 family phage protein
MARQRIVLRSNFRAAREAGKDAVADAIKKATDEMHDEASSRIDRAAGQRGYNIYSTDLDAGHSDDDGWIKFKQWWGKFFEWGTPTIVAMPFMRPAHRKGRAKLRQVLESDFEKWISRRARIR